MKKIIQELLAIKKTNPESSFVDIINEYSEINEMFDIEEFIDKIKTKEYSAVFNFIKNDLINHKYKEIPNKDKLMKELF